MSATRIDPKLGHALIELAHALETACLVSELERARAFGRPEDARRAARAVCATVSLVVRRLHELGVTLTAEPVGRRQRGKG